MPTVKHVSYSYSEALEEQGRPAYFLDVIVSQDRVMIVDIHEAFKSQAELMEAMEEVIPIFPSLTGQEIETCGDDITLDPRAEFRE